MGGCCCRCGGFVVRHHVEGQDYESYSDIKRLGLTRSEIDTFFRAFKKVDGKGRDQILISELLNYLDINPSPIALHIFSELDLSTEGMLNFREFTLSAWKFCSRRQEGISDMAFTMYDINDSGDLTTNEISTMIKDCYGEISEHNNIWTILEEFDTNEDSKVSRAEFINKCSKHPVLLAPTLAFHRKLMALICGNKTFWNNIYVSSSRTMHSKAVKMLFRTPDKINAMRQNDTSQVKGYSYDNNMGALAEKKFAKRGKDKWKVDFSSLKPKKKKVAAHNARGDYGLFD